MSGVSEALTGNSQLGSVLRAGIDQLKLQFDEDGYHDVKHKFREFELTQLFVGRYDKQNAVLAIYPGAGGDDAEDWARIQPRRKFRQKSSFSSKWRQPFAREPVGKARGLPNLFLARVGANGSLSPPFAAQVVELVDTQVSEACA